MEGVGRQEGCDKKVRNRARLRPAFVGVGLRRGSRGFEMRRKHVKRLRKTGHRDLGLEEITGKIAAIAKGRQAYAIKPLLRARDGKTAGNNTADEPIGAGIRGEAV